MCNVILNLIGLYKWSNEPAHRAPLDELGVRHERVVVVDGGGELLLQPGEERVLVGAVDTYLSEDRT